MLNKHRFIDLPPDALGFAHGSIDRAAHKRDDAHFLENALFLPDTKVVVFAGDSPIVQGNEPPFNVFFNLKNMPFAAKAAQPIFLGLDTGSARFAISLPSDVLDGAETNTDFKAVDLRSLAVKSFVEKDKLSLLATAKALISWHNKHKFCANCGYKTQIKSAGWKRVCSACDAEHFPRTDPVVIMMAVRGDLCLLGRSPHFPPLMYSCLAGFIEPGDSIESAVRQATSQMLSEVTGKRDAGLPTIPSTIGRELEYNLFMKCREERTLTLAKRDSPVEAMARLRELKNQYRSV